jgi:ubiquinone/menaquinone biosynthesis C-methylase UbiE
MENAEWYVDWFNSPYYHLLYNNRNYKEANFFIDNLCGNLKLVPGSNIWDLACGKGRHSIALNKKGFHVIGTDLSVNSITEASKCINPSLQFFVHDMRQPFKINFFDAVFNLFTSIGYFKDFNDNCAVFINVALSLKNEGVFVIDFFNSQKIIDFFMPYYTEQRGEITFKINKKIVDRAILKRIEFNDKGRNYYFEESVSLLKKKDFEDFAEHSGLHLQHCYGNYQLDPFDEKSSDRLILIFKK